MPVATPANYYPLSLHDALPIYFRNFGFAFRAGYTLSSLIDDGLVNTSDALVPGDFRAERARSLLDRRHRFVLDRKSTRLNSSHLVISYAVFCLEKNTQQTTEQR